MEILKTKYWQVKLAEDQAYLGRCVIILIRPCGDLAELSKEEQFDFFDIIKRLEKSIRISFGAEMFNLNCFMNDAYKNNPPNPQIHWHFRPRYRNKVSFEGVIFEDLEFGHHPKERRNLVSNEMLQKISNKIKSNYK